MSSDGSHTHNPCCTAHGVDMSCEQYRANPLRRGTAMLHRRQEGVGMSEFRTDPVRETEDMDGLTGIYVRAIRQNGRWGNADIAELDRDSLVAFIRSRGEVSTWAVQIVLAMLGHDREGVE